MTVRLRLRFSRCGPATWLAHLDMMRTFERSIRRAGIPVMYSSGFNPRPQLSFALPIGVGIAAEDDWLDVHLAADETQPPPDITGWIAALNEKMPQGLAVHAAEQVPGKGPSLMSLVCAAAYRLEIDGLAAAVAQLPQQVNGSEQTAWQVEKTRKGKTRLVDIRPLVLSISCETADRILLWARAGSRDHLRPDLFLQLLAKQAALDPLMAADCAITRTKIRLCQQT